MNYIPFNFRQYQVTTFSNKWHGTKRTLQIFLTLATCHKLLLENQKEIWPTASQTIIFVLNHPYNGSPLLTFEFDSPLLWKWNNISYSRHRQNLHKQTIMKRQTKISDMGFRAACFSVHPSTSLFRTPRHKVPLLPDLKSLPRHSYFNCRSFFLW